MPGQMFPNPQSLHLAPQVGWEDSEPEDPAWIGVNDVTINYQQPYFLQNLPPIARTKVSRRRVREPKNRTFEEESEQQSAHFQAPTKYSRRQKYLQEDSKKDLSQTISLDHLRNSLPEEKPCKPSAVPVLKHSKSPQIIQEPAKTDQENKKSIISTEIHVKPPVRTESGENNAKYEEIPSAVLTSQKSPLLSTINELERENTLESKKSKLTKKTSTLNSKWKLFIDSWRFISFLRSLYRETFRIRKENCESFYSSNFDNVAKDFVRQIRGPVMAHVENLLKVKRDFDPFSLASAREMNNAVNSLSVNSPGNHQIYLPNSRK